MPDEASLTADIQIRREGRRILLVVPVEKNDFRIYLTDREVAEIIKRLNAVLIVPFVE